MSLKVKAVIPANNVNPECLYPGAGTLFVGLNALENNQMHKLDPGMRRDDGCNTDCNSGRFGKIHSA